MREVFKFNLSTGIKEPLATAQHYFPNVTELLKGIYQYQQQRIMNFNENNGYHHREYYEGFYNGRNKLVQTSKYTCKSIHNVEAIR